MKRFRHKERFTEQTEQTASTVMKTSLGLPGKNFPISLFSFFNLSPGVGQER